MIRRVLFMIITIMGISHISLLIGTHANEEVPYQLLASAQRVMQDQDYITPVQPTVYLTFDDGPSHLTPLVLDILKEEGIQATFFTLGQLVERRPEMVQRIVEEGHSLGNHTYDHVYKDLYSHFDEFWKQIQKTEEIIFEAVGQKPSLIRAPGGTATNFDAFYYYYLEQGGYQVHDWSMDSGDSKRRGVPAQEIIKNVKKGPLHHEINLLLHDSSGKEETVKALPEIIRFFREEGYSFAPLMQDVKPIQFSLHPNKWKRTTSQEDYKATMQQISKFNLDRETEEVIDQSNIRSLPAMKAISTAAKSLWDPPLLLQLGHRNMVLKPTVYTMESGKFHVPIRALFEQLGGTVDWDHDQRKATITFGKQTVIYYTDTQVIKVYSKFQLVKTIHQGDFSLKNGSIMVPLQSALEMFNIHVTDYTAHEAKREVRMIL